MGFWSVDKKTDIYDIVTRAFKAWERGDRSIEIGGQEVSLIAPNGSKRVRLPLAVPANLQLFYNEGKQRASWYLDLSPFYEYQRVDASSGNEVSTNPRLAGQVKEGAKGTAMYAFREGDFNEGYFSCALKAIRDHGVPVAYVMPDESIKEIALKRGYLNEEGEVLFIPEENPRMYDKQSRPATNHKPVSPEDLSKMFAECEDIPEEAAA